MQASINSIKKNSNTNVVMALISGPVTYQSWVRINDDRTYVEQYSDKVTELNFCILEKAPMLGDCDFIELFCFLSLDILSS